MPEEPASSARLRHIGRTLRKIREDEGKTLSAVRRRLDRSPASLSAIENGLQPLRPRDLKYILEVYCAADPVRSGLMELAEQQRQQGWWLDFKDIASPSDLDYASLEHYAAAVDLAEVSFIPGLLQTEAYARAVMLAGGPGSPPDMAERFVAFRMARQQILYKPQPPRLRVTIDEAALHRSRGGPGVMRVQLTRLIEESQRDNISLRVLPFSGVTDPGLIGAFQVMDIGAPPILTLGFVDHLTGQWIVEDETEISQYREKFDYVQTVALSETDSRELIQRIISGL